MIRKTRRFGDTEFIQHQKGVEILQLKSIIMQFIYRAFRSKHVIRKWSNQHLVPSNAPANSSSDAFRLFDTQNYLRNSSHHHHKHLGIYLWSQYFASALSLWAPKCTGSQKPIHMHIYLNKNSALQFHSLSDCLYSPMTGVCFMLTVWVCQLAKASYTDHNTSRFRLAYLKAQCKSQWLCNILSH